LRLFLLVNILQIISPVRMFFETSSRVPIYFPIFEVFRSNPLELFGRLLGYLYTGVLRQGEVVFSYSSSSGIIQIRVNLWSGLPSETLRDDKLRCSKTLPKIPILEEYLVSVPESEVPRILGLGYRVPQTSFFDDPIDWKIRNNAMTSMSNDLVNWYPRNQLMSPFGKGRITKKEKKEKRNKGIVSGTFLLGQKLEKLTKN